MNKVILIGRLTKDPDLRYTPNNAPVCNFTVAIDRMPNQNGEKQTDFINVVLFNKQAENVKKYVLKGHLIAVEGSIQTRNYDDKDGKKVYVTEVLASRVQFLEGRNKSQDSNQYSSNNQTDSVSPYDFNNQNTQNSTNEQDLYASFGQTIEIDDNELPF